MTDVAMAISTDADTDAFLNAPRIITRIRIIIRIIIRISKRTAKTYYPILKNNWRNFFKPFVSFIYRTQYFAFLLTSKITCIIYHSYTENVPRIYHHVKHIRSAKYSYANVVCL